MRGAPAEPPGPPSPKPQGGDRPWSVAALASAIDGALKSGLPKRVRVLGEVSGLRERTHLYFDLRDDEAVVSCALFASMRKRTDAAALGDGAQVVCEGRVDYWAKGGRISLIVDTVSPVGAGAAAARLRELVERARGLGWLSDERKRQLPVFPRRIAVITSRSGAALQDVIDTARRRCPAVGIVLADARVQGDGAASEVASALRRINERTHGLGVDAVLVTRGGGSVEDLAAFNDWALAEAVVESTLPVVAAIGHETDTALIELVADRRAATPTQAAVMLTPDREALVEQLDLTGARLRDLLLGRVARARAEIRATATVVSSDPLRPVRDRWARLDRVSDRATRAQGLALRGRRRALAGLADRLERHRPTAALAARERRLASALAHLNAALAQRVRRDRIDALERELHRAAPRHADDLRHHVEGVARELEAVSPLAVIGRGYSITTDRSGRVIRSIGQVGPGAGVTTRLLDGTFDAEVLGEPTGEQLDLFGDRG